MRKSIKAIMSLFIITALIVSLVPSTFAATSKNLATDKNEYLAGETITVKVTGITEEQITDQQAWVGLFAKGVLTDKGSYNGEYSYVSDLGDGTTWKATAPNELGDYEIRLVVSQDGKDTAIDTVSLKIVSPKANTGDVKINKTSFLPNDTVTVTVAGLSDSQINNKAWVGLFKKGDKITASSFDGLYSYISDLSDGKTWSFKAPTEFGSYEIRVFTADPSDDQRASVLFATVALDVGANKASSDAVKLNKSSYLPNDKVTVTVSGLTQGQIDNRAWVGVFLKGDKPEASSYNGLYSYISDLSDGKTWSFKAPTEFGFYEIRVFSADPSDDQRASAIYAKVPFQIKGSTAKPGDLKINKTQFKMNEPITITITGLTPGQIEDRAWAGLYLPKDKNKASAYNGVYTYISDLRDGKTWKINAPMEPGFYEIRVFTKDPDAENRDPAFFGKLSFKVISNEQQAGYAFTVKPTAVTLAKGKTVKLDVRATPLTGGRQIPANNMVSFVSRNTKVATVTKDGVIKAVGYDAVNKTNVTYIDIKYGTKVIKSIKVTVK